MPLLSICIPIYNQRLSPLVKELKEEISNYSHSAEILLLDDGSNESFREENRLLSELDLVSYDELSENVGRSAIRNLLADKARGNYLLFLDDDSRTVDENFLKHYLDEAKPGNVVCGGRIYQNSTPAPEYMLHWKYGKLKESATADERRLKPYSFHSNNFMIDRSLFLKIKFDESLKQYGHEDTLFAYKLSINNVKVNHIDNPVLHNGLETSTAFLQKTQMGLQNLLQLYLSQPKSFRDHVRLLKEYQKVRKLGLDRLLALLYSWRSKSWENQLSSKAPDLKLFNLYKIAYFSRIRLKA